MVRGFCGVFWFGFFVCFVSEGFFLENHPAITSFDWFFNIKDPLAISGLRKYRINNTIFFNTIYREKTSRDSEFRRGQKCHWQISSSKYLKCLFVSQQRNKTSFLKYVSFIIITLGKLTMSEFIFSFKPHLGFLTGSDFFVLFCFTQKFWFCFWKPTLRTTSFKLHSLLYPDK